MNKESIKVCDQLSRLVRTGTIKCNQYFYENEWPLLQKALNAMFDRVDIKENNVYLIRCQCERFSIATNYPEYIFNISNKNGLYVVDGMAATGRLIA